MLVIDEQALAKSEMNGGDLMAEVEYRTLSEYDGYRFGSDGTVWSCWTKRMLGRTHGVRSEKTKQWHRLNAITNQGGYLFVNLKTSAGHIKRCLLVHRLVLAAFQVTKPDGKNEVCHGNGIKTDNSLENLRWGDRIDNTQDAIRHGTMRSYFREQWIANGSPVKCINCKATCNRLRTLRCQACYKYLQRTGMERPCELWMKGCLASLERGENARGAAANSIP